MNGRTTILIVLALMGATLGSRSIAAPRTLAGLPESSESREVQRIVDRAVMRTIAAFDTAGLDTSQLAVTLVDLSGPRARWASFRGGTPIYPASVVKLFYLVAAQVRLQDGTIDDTDELRRALRDMIVPSYNDATSYVLDVLTGTTSGPELSTPELAAWQEKRNAVNRYFESLGYRGINANKKPWGEGPYGREVQASRAFEPGRNVLTTDATARLLTEVVLGRIVSQERCAQMMELLRRDPFTPSNDPDDQATGFTGSALGPAMKLWSKAGWTSRVRHDAACVELGDGRRFVLVTFTEGHGSERGIIPSVARELIAAMKKP